MHLTSEVVTGSEFAGYRFETLSGSRRSSHAAGSASSGGRSSSAGSGAFLLQEAALSTLHAPWRRELHWAFTAAMEQLFALRLDRHLDVTAHH